jgi:hypothetical protein
MEISYFSATTYTSTNAPPSPLADTATCTITTASTATPIPTPQSNPEKCRKEGGRV